LHTAEVCRVACESTSRVRRESSDGGKEQHAKGEYEDDSLVIRHFVRARWIARSRWRYSIDRVGVQIRKAREDIESVEVG
jgi:hypothetical protein